MHQEKEEFNQVSHIKLSYCVPSSRTILLESIILLLRYFVYYLANGIFAFYLIGSEPLIA